METFPIPYSAKNIAVPSRKNEYLKQLFDSAGKFVNNLGWRTYFYLNKEAKKANKKERYGFKTDKAAPFAPELKPFIDEFYELICNVEFCDVSDPFQEQLKSDLEKLKETNELIVSADKTLTSGWV